MTDGSDSEMRALLASKAVDQIADYNQRGRSYKSLPNEGLVQLWQSIWNELAVEPLNAASVFQTLFVAPGQLDSVKLSGLSRYAGDNECLSLAARYLCPVVGSP
jgi:hypothetical protein